MPLSGYDAQCVSALTKHKIVSSMLEDYEEGLKWQKS